MALFKCFPGFLIRAHLVYRQGDPPCIFLLAGGSHPEKQTKLADMSLMSFARHLALRAEACFLWGEDCRPLKAAGLRHFVQNCWLQQVLHKLSCHSISLQLGVFGAGTENFTQVKIIAEINKPRSKSTSEGRRATFVASFVANVCLGIAYPHLTAEECLAR